MRANVWYRLLTLLTVWTGVDDLTLVRGVTVSGTLHAVEELLANFPNVELPPELNGTIATVEVSMYVNSFGSVSEVSMDYKLDAYIREKWLDTRLQFPVSAKNLDRVELSSHFTDKVWKPDLYFTNEKTGEVHDVTQKNELIHIYNNGTVIYTTRVSLTMACPMKLSRYPHDVQNCPLQLSTFGFTDDVVRFVWRQHQPVRFNTAIHLTQFSFDRDPITGECQLDFDIVGQFTCLEATFHLERKFGYYFLQIYLPSMLIVCLSWVSFWLPTDVAPARVTIGLITVLTLATHSAKARESIPHVSYVTGIDVWMSVCTTFVFLGMIEYAVVSMLYRNAQNAKQKLEKSNTQNAQLTTVYKWSALSTIVTDEHVDIFCRICFPLLFALFQMIYWPYYLIGRE